MALFSGVRQSQWSNNSEMCVLTAKERGAKFKNANEPNVSCELNLIEKGKSTLLPTNAKSPIYGRPTLYTKQMVLNGRNLLKTVIGINIIYPNFKKNT